MGKRAKKGGGGDKSRSANVPIRNVQTTSVVRNDGDHEAAGRSLHEAISVLKDWPLRDADMLTSWGGEAKNELLKSYRASLHRACDVSMLNRRSTITLMWKREWGAFSKFTQNDHEIAVSVSLCSGMQRFQPVCSESALKLLSSLSGRSPMLFLPVDSSFVSLLHLREGVKFVVRDPDPDLTALLAANDYVLFAGGFDVMTAACEAGVLFKEKDLVLGVVLRDAYSFFMADLSLNLFTEQCDISDHWNKITSESLVSKPEERFKLCVLYVVSRVLWLRSGQEMRSLLPRARKVLICYPARNKRNGITTIKWETHVLADCPMKVVFRIFAENLGESEAAFNFYLGNDKKSFNGNLPIGFVPKSLTFRAQLKDPRKPGCLAEYAFPGGERELLLRRLRMTRLAVVIKHVTPCGASSAMMAYFLVRQETRLDDVTRALNEVTSSAWDYSSCSWFCRINDKTLLRMSETVAGSPRDVADFVGVDPVQMELLLTVDSFGSRIKMALPFDRAPIGANVFRAGKHVNLWAGFITLSDDVSTVVCSAWISMSTALSPADHETVRRRCELWPVALQILPAVGRFGADEASILNDDNSFELLVTFCPMWWPPEPVENRAEDILIKLRDGRIERAFLLTQCRDGMSYGMLRFDQESGSFKMRLRKDTCGGVLRDLVSALGSCVKVPEMGENGLAHTDVYVQGVMTFMFKSAPCFGFVRAKSALEADLFNTTYSPEKPSHVWLEVEEEVVQRVLGDSTYHASPDPDTLMFVDVMGLIAQSLSTGKFYLIVAGTAGEVNRLVTNRDHERLARAMLLVQVKSDLVSAIWLNGRHKVRLAKYICQGRSASVEADIRDLVREEEADINKLFKKPDLSAKWALNLERAETITLAETLTPDAVEGAAGGHDEDASGAVQKGAEATALERKKERKKEKRLAAAASATEMSNDAVLAKLELLCQRLSTSILTAERSVRADSVVAEVVTRAREDVARSGPALNACALCRHRAFEMRVCSGCRVTHYCGQKCQKVDWNRHKPECKEKHRSRMGDLVKML